MRPRILPVVLVTLGLSIVPAIVFGQNVRRDLHIPNGPVHSLAEIDGKLYVGGDFTRIGPVASFGAILSASTAQIRNITPIDFGGVTDAVSDGSGGWFVGGTFLYEDGNVEHRHALHLDANGTVLPWHPDPNNNVYRVARDGSTVYLTGLFNTLSGEHRLRAGAVDAVTGALKPWNPRLDPLAVTSSSIGAIAVGGGRVYLGGFFQVVQGQPRNGLMAVDATTGDLIDWDPGVNGNGSVHSIAIGDGVVYIGGNFTMVGDSARAGLAAVDITTGQATAWNPGAGPSVDALVLSDTTLYVGGSFLSIGGTNQGALAAVSTVTGKLTSWNPAVSPFAYVPSISKSGSTIYIGGFFTEAGGQARRNVAAIDSETGLATVWDPDAGSGLVSTVLQVGSPGTELEFAL